MEGEIERVLLENEGKVLVKYAGKSITQCKWVSREGIDSSHIEEFEKRKESVNLSNSQKEEIKEFKIPKFVVDRIGDNTKELDGVSFREVHWKGINVMTFELPRHIFGGFQRVEEKKKEDDQILVQPPPPPKQEEKKVEEVEEDVNKKEEGESSKKRKRDQISSSQDSQEEKEKKSEQKEEEDVEELSPPKKKRKLDGKFSGILIKSVDYQNQGRLNGSKVLVSGVQNGEEDVENSQWMEYNSFKRHVKRFFLQNKDGERDEDEDDDKEEDGRKSKKKKRKKKKKKIEFLPI